MWSKTVMNRPTETYNDLGRGTVYGIIKIFVLFFMLTIYILFFLTITVAHHSGGWIVVLVDKYQEGFLEVILLASILPLATYVVIRETISTYRNLLRRRRDGFK